MSEPFPYSPILDSLLKLATEACEIGPARFAQAVSTLIEGEALEAQWGPDVRKVAAWLDGPVWLFMEYAAGTPALARERIAAAASHLNTRTSAPA